MATTLNSAPRMARKSLADQIDRLDSILDGLSEALNESVADAVRGVVGTAVRQAVHMSIQEVLDHPELLRLALLKHGLDTGAVASQPAMSLGQRMASLLQRAREYGDRAASSVAGKLQDLRTWTRGKLQNLRKASVTLLHQASQGTGTVLSTVAEVAQASGRQLTAFARLLWRHPVVTLLTLGTGAVGLTLGVFGPREVTATLLGVSGSLLTLGSSLLSRLRALTRSLSLHG